MTNYKVFTSDLCSPIQGGSPVWDGMLPYTAPVVELDKSQDACAVGWNFCRRASTALKIAGIWPNGYPSRLFEVEPIGDVIERGDKCRSAQITIVREVTDLRPAIEELSAPFGAHKDEMVEEQLKWRESLSRPQYDPEKVEDGLRLALGKRGLAGWTMRRFKNARAFSGACNTSYAWAARSSWSARSSWKYMSALSDWDSWYSWSARAAWYDWSYSSDMAAWADLTASDARYALTVFYSSKMSWIKQPADLMTVGIRDAYLNGLEIAIPTGKKELGWAMVEKNV